VNNETHNVLLMLDRRRLLSGSETRSFHGLFTVTAQNFTNARKPTKRKNQISPMGRGKSNAAKTDENRLFSIRSQMLYAVGLRASRAG
jgi:hypothetical protein